MLWAHRCRVPATTGSAKPPEPTTRGGFRTSKGILRIFLASVKAFPSSLTRLGLWPRLGIAALRCDSLISPRGLAPKGSHPGVFVSGATLSFRLVRWIRPWLRVNDAASSRLRLSMFVKRPVSKRVVAAVEDFML